MRANWLRGEPQLVPHHVGGAFADHDCRGIGIAETTVGMIASGLW
jgi:hypothetical protein